MTGRALPPTSPFAGDDGGVAPALAAALAAHAAGEADVAAVVAALAGTRVLVPVLAELESAEQVVVGGHAHTVEKEASAGIVALRAPDGRTALPVFSGVAAMTAWRRDARPVPSEVARAALSAVTEGWELLVLDPGGPVTVLLPRPAVWALAQQEPWRPAVSGVLAGTQDARAVDDRVVDDEVVEAVRAAVTAAVPAAGAGTSRRRWRRGSTTPGPLRDVHVLPGRRAEVAVELVLAPGLDREALDMLLRRVGEALGADETVTRRVDSIEVRVR